MPDEIFDNLSSPSPLIKGLISEGQTSQGWAGQPSTGSPTSGSVNQLLAQAFANQQQALGRIVSPQQPEPQSTPPNQNTERENSEQS